jgi:uncharacterized protein
VTLMLDTSALLVRYLDVPERSLVLDAMSADHDWCACALALAECLTLLDRLIIDPDDADAARRALRDDWERICVVPVDQRCLDEAAELGRTQPIRTIDALHLAAARRLPAPVTYVTLDHHQITVGLGLGYNVISS